MPSLTVRPASHLFCSKFHALRDLLDLAFYLFPVSCALEKARLDRWDASKWVSLPSYLYHLPQMLFNNPNFCTRLLFESATNMFPSVSNRIVCGWFNWSDDEPLDWEQPTKQRNPYGPDPTMRLFRESTMKKYPSASRITSVGPLSEIVPVDPLPATVVPFSSPDRNSWMRLFSHSATYKSNFSVTKIPPGLLSMFEANPAHPVPATMTGALAGSFNDFLSTRCWVSWEQ